MPIADYRALECAEPLPMLPVDSLVIAAVDGETVLGRTTLTNMVHLEGTWVHPEHRGGTLGVRLIREAERQAREIGLTGLLAYTPDTKIGEYMQRMGYERIPVEVWGKKV